MKVSPIASRRDLLRCCAASLPASLLASRLALAARQNGGHPLAPQPTHHPARAQHLIFVFLAGGFSHVLV